MKTIYFHLGWPKTGSTSIQYFLRDGRKRLAEAGWFYAPNFMEEAEGGAGGGRGGASGSVHSAILKELLPSRARSSALRPGYSPLHATLEAFERSECRTLVLSNENLFWSSRKLLAERLPQAWREHRVRLIAYARRFDEYYPSLYKQRLGASPDFVRDYPAFVESRLSETRVGDHVERLKQVFGGEFDLRSFERARDRGLLEDFCDALGLPQSLRTPQPERYRANVSFSDANALLVLDLRRRGAPAELISQARQQVSRGSVALDSGAPTLRIGSPELQERLRRRFNIELDDLRRRGLADLPPAEIEPEAPGLVRLVELPTEQRQAMIAGLSDELRGRLEQVLAAPAASASPKRARRRRAERRTAEPPPPPPAPARVEARRERRKARRGELGREPDV